MEALIRRFWASVLGHQPEALVERNRDIIISYLGRLQADGGRYDVDNLTRDCIAEIARKERRWALAPRPGEWLYRWEKRSDIPSEWLYLKDRIKAALSAKHSAVLEQQRRKKKERIRSASNFT